MPPPRGLVTVVMRGFERLPLTAWPEDRTRDPAEAAPPPTGHSHSEPLPTDEDGWDEPADAGWSAPLVRDHDAPEYITVWSGRVDGEDRGLLKADGAHPTRPAPPARDGRANAKPAWLVHARQAARAKRPGG